MFQYLRILSFAFLIIPTTVFAAAKYVLPKQIQATYVVSKNGKLFAEVREKYIVKGNSYLVESTTKGFGVYALLGERKLISMGKVTNQGLKPIHFELHQGNNERKKLSTDFDWSNNTLHMVIKGEVEDVPLTSGTQDLANFSYQFMFLPKPIKNDLIILLTTGKKLNKYHYRVKSEKETLSIAGQQYKTIHLVPVNNNNQQETKELWLATEQSYILVRFLMLDENGEKLEQTLTELHVQ